jgi:hypothetical protein
MKMEKKYAAPRTVKEALKVFLDSITHSTPEEQARALRELVRVAGWQERFLKDTTLGQEIFKSQEISRLLHELRPYL